MREKHPNTISIKFQRLAYPTLNVIFAVTDYVRAQIRHHRCHFHRVPSGSLSHHVPVETVEDDFVG